MLVQKLVRIDGRVPLEFDFKMTRKQFYQLPPEVRNRLRAELVKIHDALLGIVKEMPSEMFFILR